MVDGPGPKGALGRVRWGRGVLLYLPCSILGEQPLRLASHPF